MQKGMDITANELVFVSWYDRNILTLDSGKAFQIYVSTKTYLFISNERVVWYIDSISKKLLKYYCNMGKDGIILIE